MDNRGARKFIYRNARPLDIARWKYLFEKGSKEEVLTVLSVYQNEDGGFGSALEPDCWNPHSAPVQTWVATEIIREIELEDREHPIIQGILKYLDSKKDFDGHTWDNAVGTNNDHPHAPWWHFEAGQERSYNPTACLVGFILKYEKEENELYKRACRLAKEAYDYLKTNAPLESMHTVSCFVELYEYMKEGNIQGLIDMEAFKTLLQKQIQNVMTYDTSKWEVEYVCKPSLLISSRQSDFYEGNQAICKYECDFILKTQKADGTWEITWDWDNYMEQWHISKNWWKSDQIIKNLKYIKVMQE